MEIFLRIGKLVTSASVRPARLHVSHSLLPYCRQFEITLVRISKEKVGLFMPNESFDLCFGFLVFSLLEVTEDT